jgi:hypothetical protein
MSDEQTPEPQVDILGIAKRLQKDGRWREIEPIRDAMMREARAKGMPKAAAQSWVYSEIDRLYPPMVVPEPTTDDVVSGDGDAVAAPIADDAPQSSPIDDHARTREGRLQGLADIPPSWGTLPGNANLQSEIAWVQAERLSIVEESPSGATVVRLDHARSPAPSMAALAWLETSIRSYAKFVEVVAKSLSTPTDDEQQMVRRERLAIDEIRALLAQTLGSE